MPRLRKKLDVCLCADTSGSLEHWGKNINTAMKDMIRSLKTHTDLTGIDICFTLVTFATGTEVVLDFVPLNAIDESKLNLSFTGATNPAPAIQYVIEKANRRYTQWCSQGEEVYHPLIYIFTDGMPYPEKNMETYKVIADKVKSLVENRKDLVACCGFGEANVDNMSLVTDPALVVMIKDYNIEKLEKFFSMLIAQTTSSYTTQGAEQVKRMFRMFAEQ